MSKGLLVDSFGQSIEVNFPEDFFDGGLGFHGSGLDF